MNITITLKAENFMRRMVRLNGGVGGSGFRLTVSPGGCSGLASSFSVEHAPHTGDEVVVSNGVRVFLPAESRILLDGVTVDFSDSLMDGGLQFLNAGSCGCGGAEKSAAPEFATVSIASIQRKH